MSILDSDAIGGAFWQHALPDIVGERRHDAGLHGGCSVAPRGPGGTVGGKAPHRSY